MWCSRLYFVRKSKVEKWKRNYSQHAKQGTEYKTKTKGKTHSSLGQRKSYGKSVVASDESWEHTRQHSSWAGRALERRGG